MGRRQLFFHVGNPVAQRRMGRFHSIFQNFGNDADPFDLPRRNSADPAAVFLEKADRIPELGHMLQRLVKRRGVADFLESGSGGIGSRYRGGGIIGIIFGPLGIPPDGKTQQIPRTQHSISQTLAHPFQPGGQKRQHLRIIRLGV
ncbi:hypothetical protein D3C76_1338200 [compost metagenome]